MTRLYTNFLWGFDGAEQQMLVSGDRVLARDEHLEMAGDEVVDQQGRYLLPGFVDAHCHILPTGLDLKKLNLSGCSSREEVLELVRDREASLPTGEWLRAVQYDQTRYEGGHLTRDELDAISSIRPILLRHFNGHASVANSAALAAAGVEEATPDPEGGEFCRDASGRLNGVLLEHAHEAVTTAAPEPTLEEMVEAILAAGEKMHTLGIRCASDMMTGFFDLDLELQAYRLAAERGCKVRTRLYMQWAEVFHQRGVPAPRLRELVDALDGSRCAVSGIKIFADGAIGSATAAIYGRFAGTQPGSHAKGYPKGRETDGQLMYAPGRLREMVRTAHDAGYRISVHSIGDLATDLVLDAYEETDEPGRHRIEHVMLLSDEQIERLARLDVHCTMQPEFLLRFGHAYERQLGPGRRAVLKRARSVLDAGIRLSFNSDRPIVPGDPWDGILTAEHRPAGYVQTENVSRLEGLRAYTVMGADANAESSDMGGLQPGQYADFQLYELNPLGPERPTPVGLPEPALS